MPSMNTDESHRSHQAQALTTMEIATPTKINQPFTIVHSAVVLNLARRRFPLAESRLARATHHHSSKKQRASLT